MKQGKYGVENDAKMMAKGSMKNANVGRLSSSKKALSQDCMRPKDRTSWVAGGKSAGTNAK